MPQDYAQALWLPCRNFWAGNSGMEWVVVHATASGGVQTAMQLATGGEFNDGKTASVHYINDRDSSQVIQVVAETNSAWGNCCVDGNSLWPTGTNWNGKTISIENVKYSDDNAEALTPWQYRNLLLLVRDIGRRHSIPLVHGSPTQRGVIFHHDLMPIAKARCPGTFPYDTFFQDLQGAPMQPWFTYPIVVPFGNPNYDAGLGGSHDMDVAPPPNAPVTALLSGTVSDISAPDWGKQVCLKLDSPYNGVPYMAYLHLSATNPALAPGAHVNSGDVIGWVGGGNTQAQYVGTSNPTGQNFLNSTFSSSQIQCGVALMRGPAYGGAGWETFPPVDWALDPTPILAAAVKGYHMPVPTNWKDDGTTLIAPNGKRVILGFRAHILAAPAWDMANQPIENEQGLAFVEESNHGLGSGSRQIFIFGDMLEYTATRGVYGGWLGQEFGFVRADRDAVRSQLAVSTAQLGTARAALDAANAQIATLLAQLAAVPPPGPPPPDLASVRADLTSAATSLASAIAKMPS